MIIPFFITHSGCPHQCVFCNQRNITGQDRPIDASIIPRKIHEYLRTYNTDRPVHAAFYGGSFTALPNELQKSYLEAVQPFIQSGKILGIRLSTRPDCITREIVLLLKEYHVDTIELGVQSMDEGVLLLSGRGHTSTDAINAVKFLREFSITIGLQLMLGLPGDSSDTFMNTIKKVIELKPDFVRLYPLLVIKGTLLEKMYTLGMYAPLSLDEAVSLCREALVRFEKAGIDVIRIGLQSTEELEKPGTVLAGPYHPAFGQLVESAVLLDKMRSALQWRKEENASAVFRVNPADVSAAIGQQRGNIETLKNEFGLQKIRIVGDQDVLRKGCHLFLAT